MIDVTRTLASPAVVSRFSLAPPAEDNPLWSTAVELSPVAGVPVGEIPMSARMVGASGHSRADALLRGAGEAVERFALHPVTGPDPVREGQHESSRPSGPAAPAGPDGLRRPVLPAREHALADPAVTDAVLSWLPGRRLRDDATVMVPAPLVDWPSTTAGTHLFDPGPSGAAAGSSPEMALRSALLEIVERDAVTVAWERGLRLPAYAHPDHALSAVPEEACDPAAVSGAAPASAAERRAREALLRLWRQAEDAGIAPLLARIPTAVPGLWVVVGSLADPEEPAGPRPHGPLATVGLKASDSPWEAMLGAFQEAWMVRAALVHAASDPGALGPAPSDPSAPIVTEQDRIRYLLTDAGYRSVTDWVGGFVPGRGAPPRQEVSAAGVLAAVLADGGDPVAVDLTPRLPTGLREMGWQAVKVIPVGYQHLRMDETHRWSWNTGRIDSAPLRTGCTARYAGRSPFRPHPLP